MTPAEFIDDPRWAEFLPEKPEAAKKRHLPTHEDCSRLDPEAAAMHLRRGGTLGAMAGYEERPGQLDMLGAIVRAFNAREHLMIEAGTGVGKSLAYLVPSILWAHLNDTPVVISTATRNLQSQLISSDIPRALKVLGNEASHFKVALLKGRNNYLCLRAVADFFAPGFWTMTEEEQAEMPHFIEWLHETPDGDLDRYEGLPRSLLTCPGEECGGRRCPFYTRCFVYRARKNAAEAHLVIVNHALVLAEATNPGGGLLPPHGRVVLDEAHNLEDIATECLSYGFSVPALTRLLNRLMRRGRGKRARPGGILAAVERQLQKGVLAGNAAGERVGRLLQEASAIVVRVVNAAENLADLAALMLKPSGKSEMIRYCTADGRRRHSLHGLFRNYEPEQWNENDFFAAQTAFENELAALVDLLHDMRDTLDDSAPEGEFNYCADLATQVGGMAESFVAFANETNFVLRGEKDTHAYWIERVHTPKRPVFVRLVAAPLSVADDLRKMLWDVKDSCVLSSATLRVGNDFKYMARRLGFGEEQVGGGRLEVEQRNEISSAVHLGPSPSPGRYRCLTAASPFDYFRQSLVLAPDCLPDPSVDPAEYAGALAVMLADLFAATNGRALVLFTSYEMMNAVASAARAGFEKAGLTLLVQGAGLSRESMTMVLKGGGEVKVKGEGEEKVKGKGERSTMDGNNSFVSPLPSNLGLQPPTSNLQPKLGVVLFGAQSFWEGVDVAGEALSCVVLARLPFAQRTDPIVEARSERIERAGGSSFRDYYLPEAVIKFRQGFGRLIRTKADRGVVVVTDPRIVTKSYGAVFRKSIPASVHTVTDLADLLGRVADFFA